MSAKTCFLLRLTFVLCVLLRFGAAVPASASQPAFRLTPEGAELFRERGSVGYLYWGDYRDC